MQSPERTSNCESCLLKSVVEESGALENDTNSFGPALPPDFFKKNFQSIRKRETICGSVLLVKTSENEKEEVPGVAHPLLEQKDKIFIGPQIPEFLKLDQSSSEVEEKPKFTFIEENNFGPSTSLMATGDVATYNFKSAQSLGKEKFENARMSSSKRETWMTELPEKKGASFGLFPRHFKSQIQTGKESDASVWTDTPADRERKESQKKKKKDLVEEILQIKRLKERDKEMEKLAKKAAKKLKKKRSLLEMHTMSMRKKRKLENKKREREGKTLPERRPFDRNVDLQIRKFDENQKRAILNKSQLLNDRFAPGQSKFL